MSSLRVTEFLRFPAFMFFLCISLLHAVEAIFQGAFRSQGEPVAVTGKQRIEDHGDSYLTIRIDVGYQTLRMIPDSGSFDIYLIDGDDCRMTLCKPSYRPKHSKSHKSLITNPVRRDIYFGSGACSVLLGYDQVRVHDDNVDGNFIQEVKQRQLVPLWQIDSMDDDMLSVWGDGYGFQGIVGLGFKGGSGRSSSESVKEQAAANELGAPLPSIASKLLFTHVFAICLPRGDVATALGDDAVPGTSQQGMIWWGSNSIPSLNWNMTAKVVGERHWTLSMKESYFRDSEGKEFSFCEAPCAGLVDSGTSLLAMGAEYIDDILDNTKIGTLNEDCSNIKDMPDLVIDIGKDQKLVLSPETYVMKISRKILSFSGKVSIGKGKVIFLRKKVKTSFIELVDDRDDSSVCTYAFMESPITEALVQGDKHNVIILGIPLFREYTIKFDRDEETMSFAQHEEGENCSGMKQAPVASLSQAGHRQPRDRDIRVISSLESLRFPIF